MFEVEPDICARCAQPLCVISGRNHSLDGDICDECRDEEFWHEVDEPLSKYEDGYGFK